MSAQRIAISSRGHEVRSASKHAYVIVAHEFADLSIAERVALAERGDGAAAISAYILGYAASVEAAARRVKREANSGRRGVEAIKFEAAS